MKYLKDHGREVVYDAEHFFDGYNANPEFALRTLEAAKKAGADVLCLCDTNGGNLTHRIVEVVAEVRKRFDGVMGIHTHNDCDVAVANTIAAVEAGCTHVQGCINGYGERCGNANIVSIIANLELKLGHTTIGPEKLQNLNHRGALHRRTGQSADAQRSAVRRPQRLRAQRRRPRQRGVEGFGHLRAHEAGNRRQPPARAAERSFRPRQRALQAEAAWLGRAPGFRSAPAVARAHQADLEHQGYELEAAEGTFELLVREALHPGWSFFEVVSYDVTHAGWWAAPPPPSRCASRTACTPPRATAKVPMNALDMCLRQCLSTVYPQIENVRLTDYKVRVLDPKKGTAAKVRVLVEWSDHRRSWATVGVSDNVIEASWGALVDAIRLELMRLTEQDENVDKVVEDYCWGV